MSIVLRFIACAAAGLIIGMLISNLVLSIPLSFIAGVLIMLL
jgi:hypothetical protein